MNTPPPEQDTFIKPDPFFSVSTPIVPQTNSTTTTTFDNTGSSSRPRRYTQPTSITTPTIVKEEHHCQKQEDNNDDELDRISDILANLIREANDAVHGLERERGKILQQQQQRQSVRTSSRLPRPKSLSSSSSLVATSNHSTMSVQPRRRPFPTPPPPIETAPLLESFQRLDTSMAMVDSLSRDLSQEQQHHHDHFTALFIVPLLHIPHALITTLFNAAPPSLSGMVAWACLFALGNLIMGPNNNMDTTSPRRLSLPGAYHDDYLAGRNDDDNDDAQPSTNSPRIVTTTTTTVRKRRPTIVRRSIYRKRALPTSRQSMMPLLSSQTSKRATTIITTTNHTMGKNMPSNPQQHQRRNSV